MTTDIDECAGSIDACDIDNGICQNTIGSYACQCIDGFNMSPDNMCERKYTHSYTLAILKYSYN